MTTSSNKEEHRRVGRTEAGKGRGGRGIFWILGGLLVTGLVAGYAWVRGLPR